MSQNNPEPISSGDSPAEDDRIEVPGALLAGALEHMTDAFFMLDGTWRFIYLNRASETFFHRARQELLGKNVWEAFPHAARLDSYQTCEAQFNRAIRERIGVAFEVIFPPYNRWFEICAYPDFPDAEQEATAPFHLSVYLRNITPEREAEIRRRQNEERFEALVEHGADVMTVIAPDGTILYKSPNAPRLLGYVPETVIGNNLLDYVHPDEVADLRARFQQVVQETVPSHQADVFRLRHADGSWRWTETIQTDQTRNPAILGIVLNTRDITERKNLEDQMIQTGKLAALGTLAAGVAHEINNPLAAIGGHAQLLQMHPDLQVREDATQVAGLVTRIHGIVQSLRRISRSSHAPERSSGAGVQQGITPANDLNRTVESALAVMTHALRAGSVDWEMDLAADLPPAPFDSGEIEQVLINLLSNAEHALRLLPPEAPRQIHIRTGFVISSARYTITISDSGPGMSPEIQKRLFDPFFTTKPQGEGTGLGLYISHGIIAAYGGVIEVESTVGQGATFTVSLPEKPALAPAQVSQASQAEAA